jgi:hypothetical protein
MERCARAVIGFFGTLFLIALLFVPCASSRTSIRLDPYSHVYIRTTVPVHSYVFLPQYLARKARPRGNEGITARPFQWFASMAVIAFLGLMDYLVFCRRLAGGRRRFRSGPPGGPDVEGEDAPGSSGFSLLP